MTGWRATPRHPLLDTVQPLLSALGASLVSAAEMNKADVPLLWEGKVVAGVRLPALHGAMERLIESVERELGAKLALLSRAEKQRAIRLLDERGAFILRRAVEDVADARRVVDAALGNVQAVGGLAQAAELGHVDQGLELNDVHYQASQVG